METNTQKVDDYSSSHIRKTFLQQPSLRLTASSETIRNFADDVQVLWCGVGSAVTLPMLDFPPSPLEFLRDFVALSRPCIIRHALLTTDGSDLYFSVDDLVKMAPDLEIIVDVTPDGQGDCVRTVVADEGRQKEMFVKPEQRPMTLGDFQSKLRSTKINQNERTAQVDYGVTGSTDQESRVIVPLNSAPSTGFSTGKWESPDTSVFYYSRQVNSVTNNDG